MNFRDEFQRKKESRRLLKEMSPIYKKSDTELGGGIASPLHLLVIDLFCLFWRAVP